MAQRRWFLIAAVMIGGICSLGIELTASRLLQPFFGSSQLIWANVIGLTLLYLTIGYRLGGRLADRRPEPQMLGRILLFAGLATAPIPLLARPILLASASAFTSYSVGVFFGSFFGVLLLFSAPIILLGMVSPFAIRLSVKNVSTAGNTAGTLYALSTVGSIAGTFLAVLVLIPTIGTNLTFYTFALTLVVLGAVGMQRAVAWSRCRLCCCWHFSSSIYAAFVSLSSRGPRRCTKAKRFTIISRLPVRHTALTAPSRSVWC